MLQKQLFPEMKKAYCVGYPLSVSGLEREGPSFLAVGEKTLLLLLHFFVKGHYALVSGGETWSPVKEEEEEEGWTGGG